MINTKEKTINRMNITAKKESNPPPPSPPPNITIPPNPPLPKLIKL